MIAMRSALAAGRESSADLSPLFLSVVEPTRGSPCWGGVLDPFRSKACHARPEARRRPRPRARRGIRHGAGDLHAGPGVHGGRLHLRRGRVARDPALQPVRAAGRCAAGGLAGADDLHELRLRLDRPLRDDRAGGCGHGDDRLRRDLGLLRHVPAQRDRDRLRVGLGLGRRPDHQPAAARVQRRQGRQRAVPAARLLGGSDDEPLRGPRPPDVREGRRHADPVPARARGRALELDRPRPDHPRGDERRRGRAGLDRAGPRPRRHAAGLAAGRPLDARALRAAAQRARRLAGLRADGGRQAPAEHGPGQPVRLPRVAALADLPVDRRGDLGDEPRPRRGRELRVRRRAAPLHVPGGRRERHGPDRAVHAR